MKKAPQRIIPPAARFREQIEHAEADGFARGGMKLQLTLRDASQMKRDSSVAMADISFTDGVMRFLGVVTQEGGVVESHLVKAVEA